MITRFQTEILVAVCVCAVGLSVAGVATAYETEQTTPEGDIIVSPGESIQEAIDEANPGETVLVESGVYEQSITVDKNITLNATDAALLGEDISGPAIEIGSDDAVVQGWEINSYSDYAVTIDADNVSIENIDAVSTDGITTTSDDIASVIFDGVSVTDAPSGPGLDIEADQIELSNGTFENNDEQGVILDGQDIYVENATSNSNSGGMWVEDEHGFDITVAEGGVTLVDVTAIDNAAEGINIVEDTVSIDETDVTVDGATLDDNSDNNLRVAGVDTVNISNVEASGSDGDDGLRVDATEIKVTDSTFENNDERGARLVGQQITVDDVTVNDNGGGLWDDPGHGFDITVTEGSVTVTNVTAIDNSDEGVNIVEDGSSTDPSTVAVYNALLEQNGNDNIRVLGVESADFVNVDSAGSDNNDGLFAGANQIGLSNSTFVDNEERGVRLDGQQVTVDNVISSNNGGGLWDDPGHGFDITVTEGSVTVTNVTAIDNSDEGIKIVEDSAATDPSNVTVYDTTIESNSDDGLRVVGVDAVNVSHVESSGSSSDNGVLIDANQIEVVDSTLEDNDETGAVLFGTEVTVQRSATVENRDDGLRINADSFSVNHTVILDNSDVGLEVLQLETESTVRETVFESNGDAEIVNQNDPLTDATQNWWGDPDGPSDDDIVGNVLVEDPLTTPPRFASVSLSPTPVTISDVGETASVDIVVENAASGVSGYELELAVGDADVAAIGTVTPTNEPEDVDIVIDENGSAASIDVDMGANAHDPGDPVVLEVDVDGLSENDTEILVKEAAIVDIDQYQYFIDDLAIANVSVSGLDPVVGDNPPNDLNGDGLHEDINGDGKFNIFDVQALFNHLDSDAVQNHPAAFNFNEDEGPEEVTIFDVQALFDRLTDWDG